jgi:hypothetical protein
MLPSNKLFVIKSKFSEKNGKSCDIVSEKLLLPRRFKYEGKFLYYYFTNGNIKKIEVLILADRKIRISMITDEVRI